MSFTCYEYPYCEVLCQFRAGAFNDFAGLYDYCQKFTGSEAPCMESYMSCELYAPSIDTVYIQQCDTTDFYNDFNNAVNNKAMGVFLTSVMAGILAVRAVIKVIKGAVR